MIIVNLVGGLGNQLFQFSAAYAIAHDNEEIVLEYGLGSTRLLSNGEPEILAYDLPGNVRVSKREGTLAQFMTKVLGYTLGRQNALNASFFAKLHSIVIGGISQLILNLYYLRRVKVITPRNLGFSKFTRSKNTFLNGYFQTFYWADLILEKLGKLRATSIELEEYRELAMHELPTILHIRRGDYKAEQAFGLLGAEYYSNAISLLDYLGISEYIWVFSDEPDIAVRVLDLGNSKKIRVIPEMNLNSAQLLEIMKLGKAYVIANSTFSWWAAYLSGSTKIVAPATWFQSASGPSKLFPENWKLIDSVFE